MTGIEQQPFTVELGNDLFLRGNVHAPKEQTERPVVIICHGFKGHKDWNFFPYAADELAANGFYAIRFNFSCNGVNEEDFDELEKFAGNTYTRELKDLDALFEQMKARALPFSEHFEMDHIGMVGHSRGGASSIIFASEHPEIKAVVTWNGVAEVDFLGEDLKNEIRENGVGYIENKRTKQDMPIKSNLLEDIEHNKERFDIVATLKQMNTPVHIVQGGADGQWLREGAEKMNDTAAQHSLAIIEGGTHTFNAAHPLQDVPSQLRGALIETTAFFQQQIKK
ncbi:alpha/beta hydrolase family protein [Salibacterium aidingense]|uniref:alpha/beta hydrolase family protein n=1 Tax=Salibacterium aidingense TaxID=384933 RepID=UPI003BC1B300